jgi:thiol-disulfide isomerase/thioredoxin
MLLATRNTNQIDISVAPVQNVQSIADYDDVLSSNPDKLVIFKWFAPWCRSCKAMDLKFRRLAIERSDVVFCEIDVSINTELKKLHGIKTVPAVHMHAGHLGMVEDFMCGPSKLPLLTTRITKYADVEAYTRRAKGGLMEKLSSFSSEVATKLPLPSVSYLSAPRGLIEKFARLTEQSLSNDSLNERMNLGTN